jgi:predicted N-acyltransferase
VVAGTLNLVSDGVFYGRYWGCSKDIRDLHFEVCCYYPVELAIERGWQRVELGAGGQHKWGRGFLPQLTYSAHKLYIDALVEPVRAAVAKESRHLRKEIEHLKSEILKP